MPIAYLFGFIFFGLSVFSVWFKRDVKIWGSLLVCCLLSSLTGGMIDPIGIFITISWAALWFLYSKKQNFWLFSAIILLSFGFKFHLFPGFHPVTITEKFKVRLDAPLVGLFPLALCVPLSKSAKDWGRKGLLGLLVGISGIFLMALLALATGTTNFQAKLPSYSAIRFLSNFTLTAIPEEAFYRGFIQSKITQYLSPISSLFLSSLIFTLAHIFWSPSFAILAFVFIAGVLYGTTYLISNKIESSIFTHFLLNMTHMVLFSYHAM